MNYVRQFFEEDRKTMYEDIINPLKQHHINELLLYLDIAYSTRLHGKWKNREYDYKKEIEEIYAAAEDNDDIYDSKYINEIFNELNLTYNLFYCNKKWNLFNDIYNNKKTKEEVILNNGESCGIYVEIVTKVFVDELGGKIDTLFNKNKKISVTCTYQVDEQPVGTGIVMHSYETTAEIGNICVLSEFRNNDYGKYIVKNLEKLAADIGYREVEVRSPLELVGYFTKLGYHVQYEPLSLSGIRIVHMTKKLDVWSYLRKKYKLEPKV